MRTHLRVVDRGGSTVGCDCEGSNKSEMQNSSVDNKINARHAARRPFVVANVADFLMGTFFDCIIR